MRYHVRARFPDEGKKEEFLEMLTDGTVSALKPFGGEIAAAMRRAVRREGQVEWTETCYCGTPLAQERAAVYDRFFVDIRTETVEDFPGLEGESFWGWLGGGEESQKKQLQR